MATQYDPPRKKAKTAYLPLAPAAAARAEREAALSGTVFAQFVSRETGESTGPQLSLPVDATPEQLQVLLQELNPLAAEDQIKWAFFVGDKSDAPTAVSESVKASLLSGDEDVPTSEATIKIWYQPQSVFRVRAVTRCSGSLEGHTEAVLVSSFAPDGRGLASAGGDGMVRLWDADTHTPLATCAGHRSWVLALAWSPDGALVASGDKNGVIRLWDGETGESRGQLRGHTKWITALAWEPYHLVPEGKQPRLVSAGKDGGVRIWNVGSMRTEISLSGHSACVTCLRWGGTGLIYTGSQDRAVRVWAANEGILVRSLVGHGHWVNSMALSTDGVLRTGPFSVDDKTGEVPQRFDRSDPKAVAAAKAHAAAAYNRAVRGGSAPERLVTGSDDFTMFLWSPTDNKKPLERLKGHQQLVNHVSFSPDGTLVASGSFDKSVKIWCGVTGKFKGNLRGHVGAVYQVGWSGDSKHCISGSKDSTVKVWNLNTMKLREDLPGHADEVYTVDWSPDGTRVASGSKDRLLKIWRH